MKSSRRTSPAIRYLIFTALLFVSMWYLLGKKPEVIRLQPASTPSPTKVTEKSQTISAEGNEYAYSWFAADDLSKLTFIPNYERKDTSTEIIEQYSCKNIINGGFYNTDYSPIGLVVADGITISEFRKNRLFDGFVSLTGNTAMIATTFPDNAGTVIQTGPLLILNGNPLPLAIKNDERARRMVAAVTAEDTLIFLSVYTKESVYGGPLLAELPEVISAIASYNAWSLTSAINLDGGNASVFRNTSVRLGEITPVGSFLCYKD